MGTQSSQEPLFRTARQNRIFQDVVDQIQDAIIDGRLRAGDKLPAERELKDLLMLCHPDRHGNSELSNRITRKINELRRRYGNTGDD